MAKIAVNCPNGHGAMTLVGQFWFCGMCRHSQPLIDKSSHDSDLHLLSGLPSVIAIPFSEYLLEFNPVLKLHRLCDACEILTRFLTFLILGEVHRTEDARIPTALRERVASDISLPTFGRWRDMLKYLNEWLGESGDPATSGVVAFISNSLLPLLPPAEAVEASLVTLRNELAHAGYLSAETASDWLSKWHGRIENLIKAASFLNNVQLVQVDGEQFRSLTGTEIEGKIVNLPEQDAAAALEFNGHVLARLEKHLLDLWPLCNYGVAQAGGGTSESRMARRASPQIYYRHDRKKKRLLFATFGGDLPRAERYDVFQQFEDLFKLHRPDSSRMDEPVDWDREVEADARRVIGRVRERRDAKQTIKEMETGVCWIGGPAGIGKSFLMAKLASDAQTDQKFCRIVWRFQSGDVRRCTKRAFVDHAVRQLTCWLSDTLKETLPEGLDSKDPEGQLALLLDQVGSLSPPSPRDKARRVTFYLDGMDEIERVDASMLQIPFHMQKKNCVWVCVGRPERSITSAFAPERCRHLFPGGLPAMSDEDIREILMQETGSLKYDMLRLDQEVFTSGEEVRVTNSAVDAIAERAAGLPLYVYLVLEDLLTGKFSFSKLTEQLPPSLHHYFDAIISRFDLGDMAVVKTRLAATIMWAELPLQEETLLLLLQREGILLYDDDAPNMLKDALELLTSIIQLAPLSEGLTGWEPYHPSFREHLRQSQAFRGENARTREQYCRLVSDWRSLETTHPARDYVLRTGVTHMLGAGKALAAAELLVDTDFLAASVAAGLAFDLVRDYSRVHMALASEDHAPSALFLGWARFFSQHSHQLARFPQFFFQQVVNGDDPAVVTSVAGQGNVSGFLGAGPLLRQLFKPVEEPDPSWLRTLVGHTDSVSAVACDSDDRTLVSGSFDKTIKVWDLETGRLLETFIGHTDVVTDIAVSADRKWIASVGEDQTLRLWDRQRKTCAATYPITAVANQDINIIDPLGWIPIRPRVALSADASRAIVSNYGVLSFWDLPAGVCFRTIECDQDMSDLAMTADGARAITAGADRLVKEWDVETGNCLLTFRDCRDVVRRVACTGDGTSIVAACRNGTLQIWNYKQNGSIQIRALNAGLDRLTAITISGDGTLVATGGAANTVKVWKIQGIPWTEALKGPFWSFKGHTLSVRTLAFTGDGKKIISGSKDSTIRVWDLAKPPSEVKSDRAAENHEGMVVAVCLADEADIAVSAGKEGTIRVWDAATGRLRSILNNPTGSLLTADISADGNLTATGAFGSMADFQIPLMSGDPAVRLWDPLAGVCLQKLAQDDSPFRISVPKKGKKPVMLSNGPVAAVKLSPDGGRLLAGGLDGAVRIWDVSQKSCVVLQAPRDGKDDDEEIRTVAVDAGFERGAAAGTSRIIRVWNLRRGLPHMTLEGHTHTVQAIAFTPDGKRLVSGDWSGAVKLWDLENGRPTAITTSGQSAALAISVLPDNQHLLVGREDRALEVWNLDRQELVTVLATENPVRACAVRRDGLIVCGDDSGRVKFYQLVINTSGF